MLSQLTRFMLNWLLPTTCVLCRASSAGRNICTPCQQDLPILSHTCQQCAQILHEFPNNLLTCGECLKNPPPFDKTYALFAYQPPIIQLIVQLKFQQKLSHAQALGELLVTAICDQWYQNQTLPDLIMPIPLHPKRLAERGFNQAVEIAKPIASALAIPLVINGIKRVKPTLAQSGLKASLRKENIRGAFSIAGDYRGKSVAVLDDVITTGQTMREFCQILKGTGAKEIHVWGCVARRG